MSRRLIHIDLDAFFVSVEQAANPSLKGKPVVVGGRPDRRGVVAAASYEARKFGVHSALPLLTARRLCPQAIFIEGNYARYAEASRKFMAILADFSPFLEPLGIDEAYMDVTGFESIHGSILKMAEKIRRRIREELGITASVGIAGCKVAAKIASEEAKPNGVLEVPIGKEAAFMAPLAIGKLPGVGPKTEKTLRGLGVDTIGKLAALPPAAIKNRLGENARFLQNHARGIDSRPVEPPTTALSISHETTFEKDTFNTAFLESTLRYLSERVGQKLRRRGKQTKCVFIKLRLADFTTITRRRTLKTGTNLDPEIFNAGLELLLKALSPQKQAVRLIGIGVASLSETGRQLDMLNSTTRLEGLDKAVDRIRRKYGFTAIQTGRTLRLKDVFPEDKSGYTLSTKGPSR